MSLSNEYQRIHRDNGDIDACFDVMHQLIHFATDDQELINLAKKGEMKNITVADKEMSEDSGRKKFMLNLLNICTERRSMPERYGHLRADFRCFCFHASRIGLGGEFELVERTMIKNGQQDLFN